MSWLNIILAVLSALPQLITLIKKIIDAINGVPSAYKRRALRAELKEAIRQARKENSSKPLEILYTKIQNEK